MRNDFAKIFISARLCRPVAGLDFVLHCFYPAQDVAGALPRARFPLLWLPVSSLLLSHCSSVFVGCVAPRCSLTEPFRWAVSGKSAGCGVNVEQDSVFSHVMPKLLNISESKSTCFTFLQGGLFEVRLRGVLSSQCLTCSRSWLGRLSSN